ncbi:glycosyltransferase family 2 protein [Candidatus Parcubacteria bacterium]|nr:MAG: glycosyltransferase family 2 protein [Candidatus Parcubacteria bacterium]
MKKGLLSIIIVTYNNEDHIKDCLQSIAAQIGVAYEVVIIDNCSSDRTIQKVQESKIPIKIIPQEKNLGFAKANNIAVLRTKSDYLLFLNPDTKFLRNDSLMQLKETLVKNPNFGIASPQLILTDGSIQKTTRNLPTVFRAFTEYVLGIKGTFDFFLPPASGFIEVESVTGACIMIKRDVFIRAGKFNEKYFMYFEDLELCKKVRELKLQVGYDPQVKIKHIMGASGKGKDTFSMSAISARKYHGFLSYYIIQCILTPQRIMNRLRQFLPADAKN